MSNVPRSEHTNLVDFALIKDKAIQLGMISHFCYLPAWFDTQLNSLFSHLCSIAVYVYMQLGFRKNVIQMNGCLVPGNCDF